MDRNLHIIGAWVIALAVLGICSCTKGGTRKIEVNVSSITMEKEGGEEKMFRKICDINVRTDGMETKYTARDLLLPKRWSLRPMIG